MGDEIIRNKYDARLDQAKAALELLQPDQLDALSKKISENIILAKEAKKDGRRTDFMLSLFGLGVSLVGTANSFMPVADCMCKHDENNGMQMVKEKEEIKKLLSSRLEDLNKLRNEESVDSYRKKKSISPVDFFDIEEVEPLTADQILELNKAILSDKLEIDSVYKLGDLGLFEYVPEKQYEIEHEKLDAQIDAGEIIALDVLAMAFTIMLLANQPGFSARSRRVAGPPPKRPKHFKN